jgi:hypothetical protein
MVAKHLPSWWVLGFACLSLLVVAGCSGAIEVTDASDRATVQEGSLVLPATKQTLALPERDLSIVAVDFDPPLEQQKIMRRGSLALLVAVENGGARLESEVRVRARLLAGADAAAGTVLLEDERVVKVIAPGEIAIVRFESLERIPLHPRYRLEVGISPVPGEAALTDNERSLDIVVSGLK